MDPQDIVRRMDALVSDRKVIEQTWQAIEMFIRPFSGKFFREETGEQSIEWRRRNIYDGTAVMAAQSLASSLHGVLTSPATRWFGMQFRDKDLRNNHEASTWLENAALKTYNALQDSNFNLEINETYRDLTTYGTSLLVGEPQEDMAKGWKGVQFASVPIKEGYFEENKTGGVRAFYRLIRWPASRIIDKFGAENVPEKVTQAFDKADDSLFELVFAIWRREDVDENPLSGVIPPKDRPYGYMYVFKADKTIIGEEGGYYEMPVYAPRWLTTSESRWGNSPATVALADVLTLNQLVELVLKSAEKVIDPTILTEERSILADLDLGAGKINVMRNIDRIKAFESGTRMDVAQLRMEDLRMAINKYFYVDQLALKESPAMTATEVQVRYELMHRLLAGTMSRLRNDLLDPLVGRTFRLLLRAGELGEVPEAIGDADLDIEYIGPLARAQKSDQSAAVERWLMQLQQMAEIQTAAGGIPTVLMVPDWEAIARDSAKNLNIPGDMLNSEADVKKQEDGLKEQMARQAEAQTAGAEAEANKTAAEAEQIGGADGAETENTIQ